jgi:hypothetical protein
MENEINSELEEIMGEVSKNFSDKPWNNQMLEIFEKGGGILSNKEEENLICSFHTEWDKKYVRFYGEYKEKARSMKELEPLIKYLDKEGYQWV